MNETLTRTICCKLDVDGHAERLAATQRAFNAAASWIAQACWEVGIINTTTVHHRVYGETRHRFGFRSLDTLLSNQGRAIEVVNQAENGTEGLLADLTAIVYSFCARLYGQRRAKRKSSVSVEHVMQSASEDA
jgi:hypothetical protein